MKKKVALILIALLMPLQSTFAAEALVTVNGLVCAFCAQGIKKTFSKEGAVSTVEVDMDKKLVTLGFKEGQTIADDKIKEMISNAGFNVVGIERK